LANSHEDTDPNEVGEDDFELEAPRSTQRLSDDDGDDGDNNNNNNDDDDDDDDDDSFERTLPVPHSDDNPILAVERDVFRQPHRPFDVVQFYYPQPICVEFLPPEVVVMILSYIGSLRDLVRLQRVCKQVLRHTHSLFLCLCLSLSLSLCLYEYM
jgi:hypothetical protein